MINWHTYLCLIEQYPKLFDRVEGGLNIILRESIIKKFEEETGEQIGVMYEGHGRYHVVDLVEHPSSNGRIFSYMRLINKKKGVAVLPVCEDGRIILIYQFRQPEREWSWEIPRGWSDLSTPVLSAQAELEEETGISVQTSEFKFLGKIASDNGNIAGKIDIFRAEIPEAKLKHLSQRNQDPTETIKAAKAFTLFEVDSMIKAGQITDGITKAALYHYKIT